MLKLHTILIILLSIFTMVRTSKSEEENKALSVSSISLNDDKINSNLVKENFVTDYKEFIPNENWQEVKEGQAIPPGLHIRLNLQTGLKEAKLLDQKSSSIQNDSEKEELKSTDGEKFTKSELKAALKKFKLTQNDIDIEDSLHSNNHRNIEGQFKSMEELKEDFKKLRMDVKSDLEILKLVYERYKGLLNVVNKEEEKIDLLQELEYLLHQIDNANNFVDMGGVDMLIKDLNSTNVRLKSTLLLVLAAAAQSNSHAQVAYMEAGLLQKLTYLIANDNNLVVRQRALTCLSAMLRGFPFAQLSFIENGGLNIIMNFIKTPETFNEKLAVKTLILIYDIIQEQVSTQHDNMIPENLKEQKLQQYKRVPILRRAIELGLCTSLARFLVSEDHDTVEKTAQLMELILAPCQNELARFQPVIASAHANYKELGLLEGEDGYFQGISLSLGRTVSFLEEDAKHKGNEGSGFKDLHHDL